MYNSRDTPRIDEKLLKDADDGGTTSVLETIYLFEAGMKIDDEKIIFVTTGTVGAIAIPISIPTLWRTPDGRRMSLPRRRRGMVVTSEK